MWSWSFASFSSLLWESSRSSSTENAWHGKQRNSHMRSKLEPLTDPTGDAVKREYGRKQDGGYKFGLATSLQRSIRTFFLSLCAFCPSVEDTRSGFWWIWALTDRVDLMICLDCVGIRIKSLSWTGREDILNTYFLISPIG